MLTAIKEKMTDTFSDSNEDKMCDAKSTGPQSLTIDQVSYISYVPQPMKSQVRTCIHMLVVPPFCCKNNTDQ